MTLVKALPMGLPGMNEGPNMQGVQPIFENGPMKGAGAAGPNSQPTPGAQQLAQMFQMMAQGRPAEGPVGSPGRVGAQVGGAPPPMVTPGGAPSIPSLPNMTSMSQSGPAIKPPTGGGGPTEFATKAGRNMAITQQAISSFGSMVGQYKQKNWNKTASQAEQTWGAYVGLQQAIANTDDPKTKEMLSKQMQQLMEDPKTMKMFSKAHEDPTSPEGVGIQRAMQMGQAQAAQQLELAKVAQQIRESQSKAAENAAQEEHARAQTGYETKRTSQLGTVTAKDEYDRQTELLKYQQQQSAKGYNLEGRGLVPTVKGPDGHTWSFNDLQDPNMAKNVPPDAAKMLVAEYQSKKAEMDKQYTMQARTFAQQMKGWGEQMNRMQAAPLIKSYGDDVKNAMDSNMRLSRMVRNAELAKRGDQQAAVALLSDHVAMTLRQPGSNMMRPSQAQWKEAEQSSDLISRLQARWGNDGYLTGVVLTPEQVDQMTHLGITQREIDWLKASKGMEAIEGLAPKTVKMPDPNWPGLPPIDMSKISGHPAAQPVGTAKPAPSGKAGGKATIVVSPEDMK